MNAYTPDALKPTAASSEFVATTVNIDDMLSYLEHDTVALILLLLHGQEGIELGVPAFHSAILDEMYLDFEEKKSAIAVSRDHAKTTMAKIAVFKRFAYKKSRFLVYVSNTHVIAAQAVRDIANFIRSPAAVAIYGEPEFTQQEEAKGNYTFVWRGRVNIMRALGAGQQVRGINVDNQRPDLAVFDDMEKSNEDEKNKMGYKGLAKWFYGTMWKALDSRGAKTIFIGNLIENRTLLADFLASEYWRKVHLAAITPEGTPLWPARWTIQKLRQDFIEYASAGQGSTWLAEMMNIPPNAIGEDGIDLNDISIIPDIEPGNPTIEARCITVDPAISKLSSADAAVICVHVRISGVWYLADKYARRGMDPYQLSDKITELAMDWRVGLVGIESVAYQQALIHICEHENAVLGIRSIRYVAIQNHREAKNSRILAWKGMLGHGLYGLTVSQLNILNQLRQFDHMKTNNDDDEIDAASFIIFMLEHYNSDVEQQAVHVDPNAYIALSHRNIHKHLRA